MLPSRPVSDGTSFRVEHCLALGGSPELPHNIVQIALDFPLQPGGNLTVSFLIDWESFEEGTECAEGLRRMRPPVSIGRADQLSPEVGSGRYRDTCYFGCI